MVTSCFFCQNLLSDFMEDLLPTSRREEIEQHLHSCPTCTVIKKDLTATLDMLHALPSQPLTADMTLQITEAAISGKLAIFSRARVSQLVLFLAVPTLLFAGAVLTFPKLFPWFTQWRTISDESHFARYFPLLQGANDAIDEQASWLQVREPFMRSVWEEGGLSPEEFEKTFQGKGVRNEGK